MKLITRGRMAVAAMLDLALCTDRRPVALAHISARQKISLSYLELLFARLRQRGLVRSVRGPGGGYSLARSALDITMADIVLAVDDSGTVATVPLTSFGRPRDQRVASDWHAELESTMVAFLRSVSLHDLAEARCQHGQRCDPAQVIAGPCVSRLISA
ncbi:Rrf2 family transcriptional regulator [Polaromonas sp. SM01]|uniref:Rrf2 family transcriptional regulator n=1 Tax=Polaromonas sp. SM01 TaxID=3085630 RepID=UPI002981B65E|nr:Rrf2 family transcriptional regulator [Polaromonas sp. SM01]MDW5443403.1 Rrf2 family transcriptional regulator [Polaromonas sp. SM01]